MYRPCNTYEEMGKRSQGTVGAEPEAVSSRTERSRMTMYTSQDIDRLLHDSHESEVLEFKEAKSNFDSRDRSAYCAAIANEGGGKLLLGITNDRKIVGTSVYSGTINTIPNKIFQDIGISISVEEVFHPNGRVVIFDIPHEPGKRIKLNGGKYTYPVRRGESLGEMNDIETRAILNEVYPDFSTRIIPEISLDDLDPVAVENFRRKRSEKIGNLRVGTDSLERVLSDSGLLIGGQCTFACLILLGKAEKIRQFAPQAEVVFEWRTNAKQIHHDARTTWCGPYFSIYDEIWNAINSRNLRMPFQEGFIQREVFAFDEKVCREAVNNAIAHRDYSITTASVFIRASVETFSVTSPGGFLPGITPKNVLMRTQWRNRLIADALEHTQLVERSGQGIDDIFEISIRQGKGFPDFNGTDAHWVQINIPAIVQDAGFIRFLEKLANEKQIVFSLEEIIELEGLRETRMIGDLKYREKFLKLGIIEKIGKTSGTKYMLSHRYYEHREKLGEYTRIKGTTREYKKRLILEHIKREGDGQFSEFIDIFPELTRSDLHNILQELKNDGRVSFSGSKKYGTWKLTNG